uniref:Uncharacterized protein n=1 Tax=Gouania willdenowi TaxID=441366 RepID=A0A8C5I652_GOUWI
MADLRKVNGKFTGVNPAVSCCRLRQVQALLCETGSVTPDGILCSLGIDSRYNEGCTELAKYLFYGLYGRNLQVNLEEFPDEMLDDVILLIKAQCVHLYCNPLNYSYLLPYVSHWRNLHLYCMTETEYEDEEAAEEFKISSFVSMVQDCYRIGVPHSSQGHMQRFDMFMVEKWPLVQAFALEGIGGGSFFTMKYKLMDMSEKLWQVYDRLDPVSLNNLLTKDLVSFEKQWSGFFSSMDLENHLSIVELSEAQAGERCLIHAILCSSKSRQPFVLLGKHSSSEDMKSYSFNFPSESHQVRNTGPRGSAAKHMILQCVAPKGPLACSRTYFFGTTHSPYLGELHLTLLSQIYSAVVQGVLSGIKCFSCTNSASKVRKENLCFHTDFKYLSLNKASLIVHDIPDLLCDGGELGSLVFSESFLESSINIQQKDGAVSSDSCYTILTTTVPCYACWMVGSLINTTLALYQNGTCLGTALTAAEAAYVFSSSQLSTPEEGKIVFFSEGLLFVHSQYGSITLSKDHIGNIKFYDPQNCSGVASLFVEFEDNLLPHLPFPLHSSDRCLVFAFQPRSKSHRLFYSKVLSVWKHSESGLNLQIMEREHLTWNQKNMFLQHFALSSIGQEPILYDHLGALFPSADLKEPQDNLCDYVAVSPLRWVVYEPAPDNFSASHLQQYLSCFLESQRGRGGKPRLMLLTPGYTDALDVIQAVLFHPDPVVQACFTIGAVTACVNPLTSVMEHRFMFPKLLEQCSQGVVSSVVFTGLTAGQKQPLMQHIQQVVRSANPTAAFILAERGAVTRDEDVALVLSESAFSEPQMLRARYVLYPGWCKGRFLSGSGTPILTQRRVAFSRPLEKPLFVTHCKAIKSSLKPSPFNGNVYNIVGTVRFSDSEQLMDVSYNATSGSLNVLPHQSTMPLTPGPKETKTFSFLLFDGVELTEDKLKDWLRLCAKQRNKKTRNTLSPQELKTIHIRRHLDPLPPGYFYNGCQYVDIFGEKRNLHPNMEEFIKEYISEVNKEIDKFNCQLELQERADLFDP